MNKLLTFICILVVATSCNIAKTCPTYASGCCKKQPIKTQIVPEISIDPPPPASTQ